MAEKLFFNRELSWLEFNNRVLSEARDATVPLLERFRFLSIVSSNFDEFFMVRAASVIRQLRNSPDKCDVSGLTPLRQLNAIAERTKQITEEQYRCLMHDILPQLALNGIRYIKPESCTDRQRAFLDYYFTNTVFPVLTPLRISPQEMLPHIANSKLYAAFLLRKKETSLQCIMPPADSDEDNAAIIQIPAALDRIIPLPGAAEIGTADNRPAESGTAPSFQFTLLDDLITRYGKRLFPGYDVKETVLFKAVRDADFAVDENRDDDFIQAMEEVLVNRESSGIVRFVYNGRDTAIVRLLQEKCGIDPRNMYPVDGPLDLATLTPLANLPGYDHLRYPEWKQYPSQSFTPEETVMDRLKQSDVMLYVPYQSYDPVVRFLNEAAEDSAVLCIKMTLYRVSGNSPIVKALERAARNGKQVTAFIELKARFDEGRNISWAKRLEKAGVIVIYGIAHLKVHAKLLLIIRRERDGIRRYVHFSTGNYNDRTAKNYSDISVFTADPAIAHDATLFFNMISGYSAIQTMQHLVMAPTDMKLKLLSLIERESTRAAKGAPGHIMAKMNGLADPDIIAALYRANNSGVKIDLNVRGICMIVPGISGQSEHITVISIIDRYLEHSRIFYFENGGNDELYLSSADWMPRNLDRRVELMAPVISNEIKAHIKRILCTCFADTVKARILQPDGTWIRRETPPGDTAIRAQESFYTDIRNRISAHKIESKKEFKVRRLHK